jgi:hypothetical protein
MVFKLSLNSKKAIFSAAIALFLFASILACEFSMHQFGGYDLSPLIDLTWRFQSDQIPGQDYFNTWPILILVIAKIMSFASDFNWLYLTISNLILGLIVFIWSFFIISKNEDKARNRLVFQVLAAITVPILYSNHIWHSSMSQIIGIFFILSIYSIVSYPTTNFIYLGAFFSSALLSGSKQNLGVPLLIAVIVYLITCDGVRNFKLILTIFSGYLIGIVAMLGFVGMSFNDFLYIYFGPSSRLIPSKNMVLTLSGIKSNIFIFGILLVLLISFFKQMLNTRKLDKSTKLLFVALLVSLLPFVTDWDSKFNNISLPFLMIMMLLGNDHKSIVYKKYNLYNKTIFSVIPLILVLASTYGGFSRDRMMHVGPFFEKPATYKIDSKLFRGLYSGETLFFIEKELAKVAQKERGKIFMGPRIEFGYFETGNISPVGLPLYWYPGTSYSLNDENLVVENFLKNNFTLCIFAPSEDGNGDRTRIPVLIQSYINDNYYRDFTYNTLAVFRRR